MLIGSPSSLDRKAILVTGAGGGFGREFALTLAGAGASLACLDRDEHGASDCVAMLPDL